MSESTAQYLSTLGLDAAALKNTIPAQLTLSYQDGVLSLWETNNPAAQLSVNFSDGTLHHRSKQHLNAEHVIKACQIKGKNNVKVLDATCGLGTDSFLLHQAGFSVVACEKNPFVYALLRNGIERFAQQSGQKGFELKHANAMEYMPEVAVDVIYLDPMFPTKAKSAKNKKAMNLFQAIHHQHPDNAADLLQAAMTLSCQRVVIKRPSKAAYLSAVKPTFQIKGKTCRFDAYQIN